MPWAVAGAVVGGVVAAEGSKDAAETQADAMNQASGLTQRQFDQTRRDQAPWRDAGEAALISMRYMTGTADPFDQGAQNELNQLRAQESALRKRLNTLSPYQDIPGYYEAQARYRETESKLERLQELERQQRMSDAGQRQMAGAEAPGVQQMGQIRGDELLQSMPGYQLLQDGGEVDPEQLMEASPGYQFRLNQGLDAVQGSAAAGGMLNSGRALKELTRYGQGFASNEFGNIWNRLSSEYSNAYNREQQQIAAQWNRLAGLAGVGQTAVMETGRQGANAAANSGNAIMQAGNAQAAGQLGQASAIGSTISGLGNLYGQYLQRSSFNPNSSYNYANPQYSPL